MLSLLAVALAATSSSAAVPEDSGGLERRFGLEGGIFLPVNDGYGAARDLGYGAAVSMSLESDLAAFGLSFDLHFGPGELSSRYLDVGANIGVMIRPLSGAVTPIFGGGLGARYISVRGPVTEVDLGTVIRAHYERAFSDSSFGVGAHAKGGVLFFKDAPLQMWLVGEYSAVFVDGTPQAFVLSFGVAA